MPVHLMNDLTLTGERTDCEDLNAGKKRNGISDAELEQDY